MDKNYKPFVFQTMDKSAYKIFTENASEKTDTNKDLEQKEPEGLSKEEILKNAFVSIGALPESEKVEIPSIPDATVEDGTIKILVVDDDPAFCASLNRLLKTANYAPLICNEPDNTMAYIEKFKPHLVVLDLKMPGTSGSSIAAEISLNPETKNIPIIILSGLISVYDQTRTNRTDLLTYMAKTAEPTSWLETIDKLTVQFKKNQ